MRHNSARADNDAVMNGDAGVDNDAGREPYVIPDADGCLGVANETFLQRHVEVETTSIDPNECGEPYMVPDIHRCPGIDIHPFRECDVFPDENILRTLDQNFPVRNEIRRACAEDMPPIPRPDAGRDARPMIAKRLLY